ncbi:MAG: tRNA (adenosine(37)-N6)-threonylcarbamoyltransferase complex ATPase subunit type 1 TsaE [Sedimenticola sp.]
MKLTAESEVEQESIGAALARVVPSACIIYLEGDLGAGKTTLVRGFMRGLGYQGAVKSPTYAMVEPYELEGRRYFHFDLYRLADPEELEYLGVRDLLEGDAILLIEWPEKGIGELPPPDLLITINYLGEGRALLLESGTAIGESIVESLKFDIKSRN